MNWVDILKNYDRNLHLKYTRVERVEEINLQYIYSEKWKTDDDTPYVVKTHLLDSYYCLPERPDMAFTFLWKSLNSLYSDLHLINNNNERLSDAKSLNLMIDKVSSNLSLKINNSLAIGDVLELYIRAMPEKITRFIANYILKSYAIEKSGLNYKNLSTSYTTFKKKFKIIHADITSTYGEAYRKITKPKLLPNGTIDLQIKDEDKSRKIIHSLGNKVKELLSLRKVSMSTKDKNIIIVTKITSDEEYINFIIRNILYAIRNNIVHGKIASRLNSNTVNNASYFSSMYIYLLGYFFLALLLYELKYIEKNDLGIVLENYLVNIKNT